MSGLARLQHARGRRGRSGAAGPPVSGSLHLLDLIVAAYSRALGFVVAGKMCACQVALNEALRAGLSSAVAVACDPYFASDVLLC